MTFIDARPIFIEAERLAAIGQYQAALTLLDTLPFSADDPVRAGLLRGRILVQQGQFDAAIEHWQSIQTIQPDNQEIEQAIDLAMNMKDHPSRAILLRANLHLAIQYAVILLLGGIILIQAISSGIFSGKTWTPTTTLPAQNQLVLQLQEQQARQAGERLEMVLRHFYEANERQISTLEKRLEGIEKAISVTTAIVQSITLDQGVPLREVAARLTALEQTLALERESVRVLGARQEERITALGMVIGEIGTRISSTTPPQTSNTQSLTPPAH
ncbi:hypothetical protein CCP3SC1_80026 [Gammaproteobacteria bacterium]